MVLTGQRGRGSGQTAVAGGASAWPGGGCLAAGRWSCTEHVVPREGGAGRAGERESRSGSVLVSGPAVPSWLGRITRTTVLLATGGRQMAHPVALPRPVVGGEACKPLEAEPFGSEFRGNFFLLTPLLQD